jgi:hypothetical protein
VRFDFDGNGDAVDVPLTADDFNQDFGQATITTTWPVPADVGLGNVRLSVTVDPDDALPEDDEEDNSATRTIRLFNAPRDRTPPIVRRILLSDDEPFNDRDAITTRRNLRAKIEAFDPDEQGNASGLDAYCIVNYRYDTVRRRWVEQECEFQALPTAQEEDTWVVDTTVQDLVGVAYAFLWVRDNAGNISRTPAFDVISFLPSDASRLNRNDARILRIPLEDGEALDLSFTPDFGDIDVAVFDDFTNPAANLIAVSDNRGSRAEQVSLSGPGLFQVEIRARGNARFRTEAGSETGAAVRAVSHASSPLANEQPLVGGPPARQTAIDDDFTRGESAGDVYLPLIVRE